tara:strand:+ start:894 stop:2093 length:1200 start_codon:yes stop_codon:yes gene_type:complete
MILGYMNKKKLLIFFRPYKYRESDKIRFETDEYDKKIRVHYVEIYDFLYGNKLFSNSNKFNKKIKSYKKFDDIRKYLKEVTSKYQKIYLINFVPLENFRCLLTIISLYLFKKKNLKIIEISNSGFPNRLIKNYFFILIKNFQFFEIIKKVKIRLINIFSSLFNFKADLYLFAGKKKKKANIKIQSIKFNSWDYSNVQVQKKKLISSKSNYILYIDGAGPKDLSDREHLGKKHFLTSDVWYKDLNIFFSRIEKIFNSRVYISNHPLSKKKSSKYFCGRKDFTNQTMQLVKNSRFIITRQSTAISYALYFKKPILLIYSNQNEKDFYDKNIIQKLSQTLKLTPININDKIDLYTINKCIKLNKSKYKKYILNYISERKDCLPNSSILNKIILNDNWKHKSP